MSFSMHGIGVSGGIAIGHAHLISQVQFEVAQYVLPPEHIAAEMVRFDEAVHAAQEEMAALREHMPLNAPAELDAFLDMHLMMLHDPKLALAPRQMIEGQRVNAEWALKQQTESLLEQFDQMEDAYLRERRNDVLQVSQRILKALTGYPGHVPGDLSAEQGIILVAHDLSPADMLQFKQHQFGGFITDVGGTTSHTAILARSLNIPSVMALHHARQMIREDEILIVDGTQGVVIVDPDRQVLSEYKLRKTEWELSRQKLKRLRSAAATTLDGTLVELLANIELPSDVEAVRAAGASGIGLLRSEFLFMNRDDLPTEEEQFDAYRSIAETMRGAPVVIRTLDLGADKHLNGTVHYSANPALGLRAIRLCLAEPGLFETQLRAILRASVYGNVRILIPMLSSLSELKQALAFIAHAKEGLRATGTPFNPDIPVGGMIEVPAAALTTPLFAESLDFLSIGTNDLIQYTLAIDRTDDAVAHLYDPLHPAILHLLHVVLKAGQRAGVPVSVCGEIAGDEQLTRLLLGLGLRSFSMQSSHLLAVKQQILKTDLQDAVATAHKMLKAGDSEKMRALLAQLNI